MERANPLCAGCVYTYYRYIRRFCQKEGRDYERLPLWIKRNKFSQFQCAREEEEKKNAPRMIIRAREVHLVVNTAPSFTRPTRARSPELHTNNAVKRCLVDFHVKCSFYNSYCSLYVTRCFRVLFFFFLFSSDSSQWNLHTLVYLLWLHANFSFKCLGENCVAINCYIDIVFLRKWSLGEWLFSVSIKRSRHNLHLFFSKLTKCIRIKYYISMKVN